MKTLRPYQTEALAAVKADLERFSSSLIVLPTGTGKTVLFAKLASEWQGGNILVLAHRDELLNQAQQKIGAELGHAPVIEKGQKSLDAECMWQGGMVVIGSVQSMVNDKRLKKFEKTPFHLVIVDEAHHAVAPSYLKIINYFRRLNPSLKVVGVTATPNRADQTAMGLVFEKCSYQMDIGVAIDDGWLCNIQQEFILVKDLDFSNVRTNTSGANKGDFKDADLEAILIEEKPLHGMAEPVLEKCGDEPTIIFTAGVAHAHMFASILNRHKPGMARAIDGETDTVDRHQIIDDFVNRKIQYLLNFGIFTEGFDCPGVTRIVMGRPTKSVGLYLQMMGRVMRPLPGVVDGPSTPEARKAAIAGSPKPVGIVYDFVGNSSHKIITSLDVLGGNYDVEIVELAKQEITRKGGDPRKAMERAKAKFLLLQEIENRKEIKASVSWEAERIDPFAAGATPALSGLPQTRGGSTDAQIGLLVNLGVSYETAAGYSKKQASAVIEDLKSKRCTTKQKAILTRYGENPNVPFEQAKAIIDEIAANGWRPREVSA